MHSCFQPAYPFPFLLPAVLRAIFFHAPEGRLFFRSGPMQSVRRADSFLTGYTMEEVYVLYLRDAAELYGEGIAYATPDSAGMDLRACIESESLASAPLCLRASASSPGCPVWPASSIPAAASVP